MSQTNWLGLLMVGSLGAALVAFSKMTPKDNRLVTAFVRNPDGSCTYTFDDGSIEIGSCAGPTS